ARAAVVEADLDLDGGVASRVEDFPGYDDVDGRHVGLLLDVSSFRYEPNRPEKPRPGTLGGWTRPCSDRRRKFSPMSALVRRAGVDSRPGGARGPQRPRS